MWVGVVELRCNGDMEYSEMLIRGNANGVRNEPLVMSKSAHRHAKTRSQPILSDHCTFLF